VKVQANSSISSKLNNNYEIDPEKDRSTHSMIRKLNQEIMNNYEEDDLSIELEASSMQITNFNKSFEIESATDLKNNKSPSIKPKQNLSNDSPISLSSNIKDNKTFEETENKNRKRTFELQRENEELKNKLKLYENKSPSTLNKDEAKRINEENLKLIEELEDFKAKVLIRIINIYDVYIII